MQLKRRLCLFGLLLLPSLPALAGLEVGSLAPDFTLQAVRAGKTFNFSLKEALSEGPVVLYFFPAAFSAGCSIEAYTFAEAIDDFRAAGASVIGVSSDDLITLSAFSKQACQGRFAVASDEDLKVIKSFEATMQTRPEYATRVSFVINVDGRIAYVYKNLEPTRHVARALAAVQQLARESAKK